MQSIIEAYYIMEIFLGLIGALIGGLCSVIAVIISNQHSLKQWKSAQEEERKRWLADQHFTHLSENIRSFFTELLDLKIGVQEISIVDFTDINKLNEEMRKISSSFTNVHKELYLLSMFLDFKDFEKFSNSIYNFEKKIQAFYEKCENNNCSEDDCKALRNNYGEVLGSIWDSLRVKYFYTDKFLDILNSWNN